LSFEQQKAAGVTPDLIRLSVGLEGIDDLLWDIERSLEKSAVV
jgi:O-acetylhomoserine (thiol)-lyase